MNKQKIPEILLQNLWQSGELFGQNLQTVDGKSVDVVFQGWFNGSWGPDFKDARIKVDQDVFFGDVELHVDEGAWYQHSHDSDAAYNRVILHVFVNSGQKQAKNNFEQLIPSVCLQDSSLNDFFTSVSHDQCFAQDRLPGACGLLLNERKKIALQKIILQAAESRLLLKATNFQITNGMGLGERSEDILFQSLFRSLGYGNHVESFVSLASRFPYSKIKVFFRSLARQSRLEILSRWLGYLNYFENVDLEQIHPELRREWIAFSENWSSFQQEGINNPSKPKTPSRPLNSPVRRLFGFYYHLEHVAFEGLVRSWLKFLRSCDELMVLEKPRKHILKELDSMFPQPDWEILSHSISNLKDSKRTTRTRLVGKQRQLIILVNSIIPFFLCWARLNQNKKLERTLFSLILVLPEEGKNHKTRFMENRFKIDPNDSILKRNLAYHQGLVQLHDDYCTSFYEGCSQCTLLEMLNSLTQ